MVQWSVFFDITTSVMPSSVEKPSLMKKHQRYTNKQSITTNNNTFLLLTETIAIGNAPSTLLV